MKKEDVFELTREAGQIGKKFFTTGFSQKTKSGEHDIVTEADEAISDFFVEKIQSLFPGHHIKTEELAEDVNPGAQYEWIIDPIDGTWLFAHHIPMWAVMVAVLKDGEPYVSCVYFPMNDDMYTAFQEEGAYKNGEQIHVGKRTEINSAIGYVHRTAEFGPYGVFVDKFKKAYARLANDTDAKMVNLCSAASWAYLAEGTADFCFGNGGLDWDRLPIAHILRESGAVVTDGDGEDWQRGRQDMIASNKELHPKLLQLFRP